MIVSYSNDSLLYTFILNISFYLKLFTLILQRPHDGDCESCIIYSHVIIPLLKMSITFALRRISRTSLWKKTLTFIPYTLV